MPVAKARGHSWQFKARFRRHAFGWKSQPAIARLREAVSEITLVARVDPVLGAESAVVLLERLSPALEQVDSSSGAIGTAVNHAIAQLVAIIVAAPADQDTRAAWLERLFDAHAADQIPYIERLADYWGELCDSPEVASAWADRLIGITRLALSPDRTSAATSTAPRHAWAPSSRPAATRNSWRSFRPTPSGPTSSGR